MASIQELRKKYMHLYPSDGIDECVIRRIEDILKIKLPEDFWQIADFYSGGLLGGISGFSFAYEDITPNIVEETLRLRKAIKLPSRYIVLAEPPESLIVMDTENTPSIIWCDATDAIRISDMSFITRPQTWSTYLEFFAELLEDEEAEQSE
jgi:hypothetical protein